MFYSQGRGSGRGQGSGSGQGRGQGRGGGRGRNGGSGAGTGGFCVCPSCGKKIPHQRGVPCYDTQCPECGTQMMRAQTDR